MGASESKSSVSFRQCIFRQKPVTLPQVSTKIDSIKKTPSTTTDQPLLIQTVSDEQLHKHVKNQCIWDPSLQNDTDDMQWIRMQSYKSMEPYTDRVERYLNSLQIPVEDMKTMVNSFVHELEVGLQAHQRHPHTWIPQECSFKMLDSCITQLPTGLEKGIFYALDFGGTNFRVVRVFMPGDGTVEVQQRQASLLSAELDKELCPKGLMDGHATAKEMFDFFSLNVEIFMKEQGDFDTVVPIQAGFTFSFPCSQREINSAILMSWTKGFETGRLTEDVVEGLDVAELMNVAFKRNGVPVICNSVCNDTVGTLLSCAFETDKKAYPPCTVGMILGTGMNCCYYDESALQFGYSGKLINIECGNFNRDLPRIIADCELDFKAIDNRGLQQTEKMCSGAYLGEVSRMTLIKILQKRAPPLAWKPYTLTTEHLSMIVNDKSSKLTVTYKVIAEEWRTELCFEDLVVVHRVATAVMDRSAALAAVLIAGCAKKTGRLQPAFGGISVGIDGSLYKRNPWYQTRVRYHLESILGTGASKLIYLLLADDGSGKGAGILAATLASATSSYTARLLQKA